MRSRVLWLTIVLGASFYIFSFFVGEDTGLGQRLHLTSIQTNLSRAINVVVTMALFLGIINLFWIHGANVLRRKKGWPLSIVVFGTFAAVTAALLWQYGLDADQRTLEDDAAGALKTYRQAFELTDPAERDRALVAMSPRDLELANRYYEYQATYRFEPRLFYMESVYNPLVSTVMALLGFYITYAAYRAFRIRSLEATVMMLSAAVVILGSDPIGGWLSVQLNALFGGGHAIDLPFWADLDNRVANSGMQRGLNIGISVAVIAVSLRILLGLERGLTQVTPGGE
jgi:hypothetical protein